MLSSAVILAHAAADAATGWALLRWRPAARSSAETLCLALLLGMYVETLVVGALLAAGLPLSTSAVVTLVAAAMLVATTIRRHPLRMPSIQLPRPRWYEWLLAAAIGEKLLFVTWLLTRTDIFFDDAMTIWSARGRALFGGTNWSLDPASPLFLAGHIRHDIVHYPWLPSLWRALTATMRGVWDDTVARGDGLVLFGVLVIAVWSTVRRLSPRRWLAAGAAFTVAAIPLQAWHAVSGYADITVEAFVTVGLAAIVRREWMWAGTMAAGAVWSKNEGLAIWAPALLAAALMPRLSRETGRIALQFAAGFATIMPWLLFKAYHRLGVAPNFPFAWHAEALPLLRDALLPNPTNGVLWIAVLACVLGTCRHLSRDRDGRALLAMFCFSFTALVGVFSLTEAYVFLANGTTIHRSLLQLSGVAVVTSAYGVELSLRSGDSSRFTATPSHGTTC